MGACFVGVLQLAIVALMLVSLWKIFEKAGRQGWEGIVPFYNVYLLTQILGLPIMWFIFMFIPCLNIVAGVMISLALTKAFGKEQPFAIGVILLPIVFLPLLAFGEDKFTAPTPPTAPPAVK